MSRTAPELKTPQELRTMRRAGLVVARALAAAAQAVRPGVSTAELDAVAAEVIASAGATPSFLGYHGFPAVTCISVNDEVVHGIPGGRLLGEGDLVSIDCGAVVDGFHGDAAVTVPVGTATPEALQLSATTREALWDGIAAARLGGRVSDISAAVEGAVRRREPDGVAYGIVEDYTGHGIGTAMHQPPDVPNHTTSRLRRALYRAVAPRIVPGLALAVEPMVTLGSPECEELDDGWTAVTSDGSLAAHWEHTMTVTEHGVWVLTAEDGGAAELAARGVPMGALSD